MLARVSNEPILLGADPKRSTAPFPTLGRQNERLRAALIRAGAGNQPLRSILGQAQDLGYDRDELVRVAQSLGDKGLLQFEQPLHLDSTLRLRA